MHLAGCCPYLNVDAEHDVRVLPAQEWFHAAYMTVPAALKPINCSILHLHMLDEEDEQT